MADNADTERAAFEAWAGPAIGRIWRSTEPGFTHHYADSHTQFAWTAWQASRASLKEEAGWQPIETAPKDGRSILLTAIGRVTVGGWLTDIDHGAEYEGQTGQAGWWVLDSLDEADPTHWMPLPAPPALENPHGR